MWNKQLNSALTNFCVIIQSLKAECFTLGGFSSFFLIFLCTVKPGSSLSKLFPNKEKFNSRGSARQHAFVASLYMSGMNLQMIARLFWNFHMREYMTYMGACHFLGSYFQEKIPERVCQFFRKIPERVIMSGRNSR